MSGAKESKTQKIKQNGVNLNCETVIFQLLEPSFLIFFVKSRSVKVLSKKNYELTRKYPHPSCVNAHNCFEPTLGKH